MGNTRVPPSPRTTVIETWRTGLYTHRSQLFAPFKVLGVSVIQFHDALIDGQDMEVLDTLEIQRRPGFSRFCSQQLAANEVPNQFYSCRTPTGTVLPLMDTNQRFTLFSSTTITTLWSKASSAQAFPLLVGSQLYACNGTVNGQKRINTADNSLHGLGIPAPATRPTVATPTTAGATFWQPGINFGGHLVVILDPNGNIQISNNTLVTGTVPPMWSTIPGAHTPEATGFWICLGPPQAWVANTAYTIQAVGAGQCIFDSNGNVQQLTFGGTSGSSQPAWSTTVGSTTTDNTATWTCRSNSGAQSVFNGYQHLYVYSTQAPTVSTGYYHCSTSSPETYSTGPVFGAWNYNISGAYSTNTDVGSVDIYRIRDGGSVFEYAGSVANNTAGGTWTFTDNVADGNLSPGILATLSTTHLNDPPPGQTGSIAPSTDKAGYFAYWQGRLWTIAGNKVYFDAGPDCQNGDPHASWPPANLFTFPGQPMALAPTNVGLLVILADSVKMILGGPQTAAFYPSDLMENFGISSPNCIARDRGTIRVLTTQGQLVSLIEGETADEGFYIGDIIQTFPEASSYVTVHRDGLDAGAYVANGTDTVMRYSLNLTSWSPKYKPVGGIGALRSIETSVGNYTLCAGRTTGAGYILGRDLTTYQDDGQNYSNCFVTVGNIVLSQPGQALLPVLYILGYFNNVGSVPTVSILPNEINDTSGASFIPLPGPQDELLVGGGSQGVQSLMAKQWNTRNAQTLAKSQLMHHLQVKIAFAAENAANTLKTLVLKHTEED